MNFVKPFCALALLALSQLPAAAQKVELRPHWEPGKVYTHEQVTEMEVTGANLPGASATKVTQQTSTRVRSESGTGRKLAEVTFGRVQATVTSGGGVKSYDSEDPAKSEPFLQQAFGALVGQKFTLVFDKEDRFVELRDIEALQGTPLGSGNAPSGAQFAEAMRKSFEMYLPKAALAPGDGWTSEDKLDMPPITLAVKVTGKYAGNVEKDGKKLARLEVGGEMNSPAGQTAMAVQPGSTLTGEVLYDLERRVLLSQDILSKLKASVNGTALSISTRSVQRLTAVEAAK